MKAHGGKVKRIHLDMAASTSRSRNPATITTVQNATSFVDSDVKKTPPISHPEKNPMIKELGFILERGLFV